MMIEEEEKILDKPTVLVVDDQASVRQSLMTELRHAGVTELVPGYIAPELDDFFADAAASGLSVENAFSTWDLRPFGPDATFLVAFLTRA